MKILFLTPYPFDEVGSQRFRFEQYYNDLKKEQIQFKFKSFYLPWVYRILYDKKKGPLKIIGILCGFIIRIFHIFQSIPYSFVFIHRELSPIGPPIFEWILAKIFQKKIIYDFDDAIWLETKSQQNFLASKLKCHWKVASICNLSYKISCGNSYLASFAKKYNKHVIVNPTTINTRNNLPEKESSNNIIIGWTGTHSTLAYLEPIIPAIEEIVSKNLNVKFLVICNHYPEFDIPKFIFKRWNKQTEIQDLNLIDIGIMPVPDTEWARGKCGFKILQYSSLKIPAIASPIGVNKEIISENQNGFFAITKKDWFNKIQTLINNKPLRAEIGKNGRIFLEKYYSLDANLTNFLGLFDKCNIKKSAIR